MIPYKIIQDVNPASVPENSSNLNVNVNFNILKQCLVNEQGFDKLTIEGKTILGACILPDNTICVFSRLDATIPVSEIGVLSDTSYTSILKDKETVLLGFTTEHQIQAECKVNYEGDYVVYWVDGFNPDRWLNISNLQIETVTTGTDIVIKDNKQLPLMLGFAPTKGEYISSESTVVIGGSLTAAVYYVVCTYGDKFKNFTKPLYISSPIPVVQSEGTFNKDFIGTKAGLVTNKAIKISIDHTRLNLEYDFIRVDVVKKENQILTGWNIGDFNIKDNNFTCVIDHLDNEVSPESILINLVDYTSSLAITQLDDVLYKAHLKTRAHFDFQPYVNNTKVNYIQKGVNLQIENYKDPNYCFYSKGFMYDEVYALYQSFIIEEDGYEYETEAYHIPGRGEAQIDIGGIRPPVGAFLHLANENDLISDLAPDYYSNEYYTGDSNSNAPLSQMLGVSEFAKVFHAVSTADNSLADTNMGYWENENETYTDLDKWLVKDEDGSQIANFKGNKVRHHKFPEPFNADNSDYSIHWSNEDYNQVNILGVKLSNIVIPTEYQDKVKRIKLYYAKRDYNNRTILGQSLLSTLNSFHVRGTDTTWKGTIINSTGNLLFTEMPCSGDDDPNDVGVYPLTYELDTAIGTANNPTSKWYRYDDNATGPGSGPSDYWNGFVKMKPFDMMQQSLTVNPATHIKNLYRVCGRYDGEILDTNTNLADAKQSFKVGFIFDPTKTQENIKITDSSTKYLGIDRKINSYTLPLYNQYRKIENAEYVDMATPTDKGVYYNSPYNFEMDAYNYQGEKAIWLQTNTRLLAARNTTFCNISSVSTSGTTHTFYGTNTFEPYDLVRLTVSGGGFLAFVIVVSATSTEFVAYSAGSLSTAVGASFVNCRHSDIASIRYLSNDHFNQSLTDYTGGFTNQTEAYSSPYISNICAFKLNIFESFDNQTLCEAGLWEYPSGAIDDEYHIWGGDTFTSLYAERETMNLDAQTPGNAFANTEGYVTGIHSYICQSTSNINYRYKGDSSWETFFPKTMFEELSNLPFINPEWYGYNPDYSAVNDLRQPNISPNGINQIQTSFPNRVIRSGVDNPETTNDNYLSFEVGDYKDFGKAKGEIQNITTHNNKLAIKTNNSLFYTLGKEILKSENSESYVGGGDIFAVKPKETVSSDSYGGGIGRFSDVVTQYGYMYADTTNGIVYSVNDTQHGPAIEEISKEGMEIFFRNELKFKFNKQFYELYMSIVPIYGLSGATYYPETYVKYNNILYKCKQTNASSDHIYPTDTEWWEKVNFYTLTDNISDIQGIGVHAIFDYKYKRYILYKKDFDIISFGTDFLPNLPTTDPEDYYGKYVYYNGNIYLLIEKTWAIDDPIPPDTFLLPYGNWGEKINFLDLCTFNILKDKSFTMAYYPEMKSWVSLYNYSPEFLFNGLDKVYSTKGNIVYKHNSDTQNNFYYDENVIESFIEPILNTPIGSKKFSSISFYTDVYVKKAVNKVLNYLDTFTSFFVRNVWQMSKEKTLVNTVNVRNSERYFTTNDFRDFTRNNGEPLMTTDYIPIQNSVNLNVNKHASLQKKFVDYFLIPRFKFKQSWITKDDSLDISNYDLESGSFVFNIGDSIKWGSGAKIAIITKIVTDNTYKVEYRKGTVVTETIEGFDYLPNKEIHIYDVSSQTTKNIR